MIKKLLFAASIVLVMLCKSMDINNNNNVVEFSFSALPIPVQEYTAICLIEQSQSVSDTLKNIYNLTMVNKAMCNVFQAKLHALKTDPERASSIIWLNALEAKFGKVQVGFRFGRAKMGFEKGKFEVDKYTTIMKDQKLNEDDKKRFLRHCLAWAVDGREDENLIQSLAKQANYEYLISCKQSYPIYKQLKVAGKLYKWEYYTELPVLMMAVLKKKSKVLSYLADVDTSQNYCMRMNEKFNQALLFEYTNFLSLLKQQDEEYKLLFEANNKQSFNATDPLRGILADEKTGREYVRLSCNDLQRIWGEYPLVWDRSVSLDGLLPF